MKLSRLLAMASAPIIAFSVFAANPSQAATYTVVSEHPSIAAQSSSAGKIINDLGVDGNEIYMAYGDYSNNTGPIDVAVYNVSTGLNSVKLTMPTEEVMAYRKFDDKLYAAWADPRICWTCPGAYSTNESGSWQNVYNAPAGQHWFDITKVNGQLVLVGSFSDPVTGGEGGAAAYAKKAGGWELISNDRNNPVTGYERYYWTATFGGKAYFQANMYPYSTPGNLKSYDGNNVSTVNAPRNLSNVNAKLMEPFSGMLYVGSQAWDGRKWYAGFNSGNVQDLFVYKTNIYAVNFDGDVFVHNGDVGKGKNTGIYWTKIGTTGVYGATSIAVVNDKVYLGNRDGQLIRTSITVNPTVTATVSGGKKGNGKG